MTYLKLIVNGMPILVVLCILIMPWIITFCKKKKQLGVTWDIPLTSTIEIHGKELKCSHCQGTQFSKREGLLTTTWVSFFRLAFWNRSASCFICQNCKFAHWFLSPCEKTQIKRRSE